MDYPPQHIHCWASYNSSTPTMSTMSKKVQCDCIVSVIIIKHGLSKVKLLPLIAAIVILGVAVVHTGIPYLTSAYQYEAFCKGILVSDTVLTRIAYMHIGLSVLSIVTPARLISIATIIAIAMYIFISSGAL